MCQKRVLINAERCSQLQHFLQTNHVEFDVSTNIQANKNGPSSYLLNWTVKLFTEMDHQPSQMLTNDHLMNVMVISDINQTKKWQWQNGP